MYSRHLTARVRARKLAQRSVHRPANGARGLPFDCPRATPREPVRGGRRSGPRARQDRRPILLPHPTFLAAAPSSRMAPSLTEPPPHHTTLPRATHTRPRHKFGSHHPNVETARAAVAQGPGSHSVYTHIVSRRRSLGSATAASDVSLAVVSLQVATTQVPARTVPAAGSGHPPPRWGTRRAKSLTKPPLLRRTPCTWLSEL
jgi:hypothetical protein